MRSSAVIQPRTPSGSRRSPFNKENKEVTSEGKAMAGRDIFGSRVMSEPRIRIRHAFSSVNAGRQERCSLGGVSTPNTARLNTSDDAVTPFTITREDVDVILNLKMKGKGKFDFKGKSEQMMDYIRKLRACIRVLQQSEETYIQEKNKTYEQLLEERKTHEATEELLKGKQEELEMDLLNVKNVCKMLEEKLCMADAERKSLLSEQEQRVADLQAANAEIHCLRGQLDDYRKEIESANEQVVALQEINKRLQEYNASLQMYNSKMQTDAAAAAETISKIQKEKSSMMEALSSLKGHSVALQEQLNQAKESMLEGVNQRKLLMDEQEKLHVELRHAIETEKQQAAQLESLSAELEVYKESSRISAVELDNLKTKSTLLEEEKDAQAKELTELREQIKTANNRLQMAETTVVQHQNEGAEQKAILEDLKCKLFEAEQRVRDGDILRRQLHNTILELKGNVRVFCRVRPLLPEEEECPDGQPVLQYPTSAELLGRGIELFQPQGQKHAFTFDKVFGPETGQKDVFVEISQLIQSALDGYKVCIFAYGQTGSGKTYTMLGNPDDIEEKGVIPRSLEQIFESSQALSSQGWTFQIQASMLEIYNETIRDLLSTGSKNGTPSKQFSVKHDLNGCTSVSDLTVVEVNKWQEVSALLHQAAQSRAIGKTAINEQSSRSHCVFTLRISGFNEAIDQQVSGVLNLIDLAGSERLSRTGSVGDRLKETQAINKSLASLGDVILAIANRDQHVPYRNSKLTYLLQPCLGGDSKTLMFVNVSPDVRSANESLCSLRFAAKVNACDIGVPRRSTHTF